MCKASSRTSSTWHGASRYQVAAHVCDWKSPGALRRVALQRLQMINVGWHKRKHQEAQAEWDGWRQIEAEGEAQVKYPHITVADGVDKRSLKVLLSSFSLKNNLRERPRRLRKHILTAVCRPKEFKHTVVISNSRAAVDYLSWDLCFTATFQTTLWKTKLKPDDLTENLTGGRRNTPDSHLPPCELPFKFLTWRLGKRLIITVNHSSSGK